jgi:hypothetical protein
MSKRSTMWRRRRLVVALTLSSTLPSAVIQCIMEKCSSYVQRSPSCLAEFVWPGKRLSGDCIDHQTCYENRVNFVWSRCWGVAGYQFLQYVVPCWRCRVCKCQSTTKQNIYVTTGYGWKCVVLGRHPLSKISKMEPSWAWADPSY